LLVLITLLRTEECIRLRPSKLRIHWQMLSKIFRVGIPAAIQMAITSFSNIFVQSYINFFGENCMSGWTTYAKVDQLLFLPMQSISLASTTFMGQNLGKNQVQRARKGVTVSLLLAMVSTVVLMIPVLLFSPQIVAFFNDKPEVVEYGSMLLRWLSPFYILCCFNQIYSGALRGAGNTKAPMIIMLTSFVAFRQVYLFVMARLCNEIIPIAMSYPAGWLLCSLLTAIYYHKAQLSRSRLVD
jgi:Na+-driven multidrug efflux pump